MKLHIYAYATRQDTDGSTDFALPKKHRLLAHWCNHPGLYDFFETLYGMHGGEQELFRGTTVRLVSCDITTFAEKVEYGELPRNSDWLFGDADTCTRKSYELFIRDALKAIDRGEDIIIRTV